MSEPVLHLIVGSNGAGKSTLFAKVIEPVTRLELINADIIAAERWPDDQAAHAYDAAAVAAELRDVRIGERASFATETVFSHPSKLEILHNARAAGYHSTLHVVVIPEELAVARVVERVANGGHHVPEQKIRERYQRLWDLVAEAIPLVEKAFVYDNSRARTPFRRIALFEGGELLGDADWPSWTPAALRDIAS